MADKTVGDLPRVTDLNLTDLYICERNHAAKSVTGQTLRNWLLDVAKSHGGIAKIEKTGSTGTEGDGKVDHYLITFTDNTSYAYDLKNGLKGDKGNPPTFLRTEVSYARSTSATSTPTSWSSSIPTVNSGEFLWTRTNLVFDTGSNYSYSVARYGRDGTGTVNSVDGVEADNNRNVPLNAIKHTDAMSLASIIAAGAALNGKVPTAEAAKELSDAINARSITGKITSGNYIHYYIHQPSLTPTGLSFWDVTNAADNQAHGPALCIMNKQNANGQNSFAMLVGYEYADNRFYCSIHMGYTGNATEGITWKQMLRA